MRRPLTPPHPAHYLEVNVSNASPVFTRRTVPLLLTWDGPVDVAAYVLTARPELVVYRTPHCYAVWHAPTGLRLSREFTRSTAARRLAVRIAAALGGADISSTRPGEVRRAFEAVPAVMELLLAQ